MAATATRLDGDRFYELKDGVWYLIEDEENMGQGDPHALMAIALFEMLKELLRGLPLARVFHDIFIHWDKARGDGCVAPDLAVFPRMEPRERSAIYLWEEASWPIVVVEVLSKNTKAKDRGEKLRTYQDKLRVPEYFICDPTEGAQKVWGHRLVDGKYRQIAPDDRDRVWSEELHAWFGPDEGGMLQVWDASGRRMSRHELTLEERDEARAERDAERQRAEAALREASEQAQWREAAEARARELEETVRRLQTSRDGEDNGTH